MSALMVAWFFTANRLRWPSAIPVRWGQFALQAMVFGAILSQIVEGIPNYHLYYVVGLLAIAIYNSGTLVGSELLSDAQYGIEDYLLTLPVSRHALYIGRLIEAGLLGLLLVYPPAIVVLIVAGQFSVSAMVFLLALTAGAAVGLAGLAIAFAAAFRQYEAFLMVNNFVEAFATRLSSAFYPLVAMPAIYAVLALYNPISHIVWLLHPQFGLTSGSAGGYAVLFAWLIAAFIGGDWVFRHRLEGRRRL